jgi:D-alanine transfer protein
MFKSVLVYLVPLLCALVILSRVSSTIDTHYLASKTELGVDSNIHFLENYRSKTYYEQQFLNRNNTIWLLGSSELTTATNAIPYNFINNNYATKLVAVGHAGNQCLSIYGQLLANAEKLKNAPIVIILSPSWFIGESSQGTSTQSFLEFNSSYFLNKVINNKNDIDLKKYEADRIANFYTDIANPDLSFKIINFHNQASKSILHFVMYYPIIKIDEALNNVKFLSLDITDASKIGTNKLTTNEIKTTNWDSLYILSKKQQAVDANNNNWGVNNAYYSEHIKGTHSALTIVNNENNTELKDFKMLVTLLKQKQVNASFIITPLNPYFYTNCNDLSPLVNMLKNELAANKLPCLNLWNADSTTYEKALLRDVMHVGDYGWYKTNKFIVDTYNLQANETK